MLHFKSHIKAYNKKLLAKELLDIALAIERENSAGADFTEAGILEGYWTLDKIQEDNKGRIHGKTHTGKLCKNV